MAFRCVVGEADAAIGAGADVLAHAQIDVGPGEGDLALPVGLALAIQLKHQARAVAVGNALASAVVFPQTMGVVIVGAVDGLWPQSNAQRMHRGRHQRLQDRFQVAGDGLGGNLGAIQRRHRAGRCDMLDRAHGGGEEQSGRAGAGLPLHAVGLQGHHQRVVDAVVDGALDALLDGAEVEHHRLLVEVAFQFDVDNPGLAHEAARAVQVGEIRDGEMVDEEAGHELPQ